jgi:putative hydrolase of the HAD superfamily
VSIRAVLFDVGGPLDTEVISERAIDAEIRRRLAEAGIRVTEDQYRAANDWAVASFAPDAYSAILWRLTGGDPELSVRLRPAFPGRVFELRAGIKQLLSRLHASGLLLGLAANQPASVLEDLDRLGIGGYFSHRQVSEHYGLRKPDVRLFLRACRDLGVEPAETVMVGDRIDNDIVPARVLGMGTVLFRTGRHADQQPRAADEVPDCEVHSVAELREALATLSGLAL